MSMWEYTLPRIFFYLRAFKGIEELGDRRFSGGAKVKIRKTIRTGYRKIRDNSFSFSTNMTSRPVSIYGVEQH